MKTQIFHFISNLGLRHQSRPNGDEAQGESQIKSKGWQNEATHQAEEIWQLATAATSKVSREATSSSRSRQRDCEWQNEIIDETEESNMSQ